MANNDRVWERGWDGHDREQLIRLARLPLPQKLLWLEEAHRLVRQLNGDAPSRRSADMSEPDVSARRRTPE